MTIAKFVPLSIVLFLVSIGGLSAASLKEIQSKGSILVCAFDSRLPYSTSQGPTQGLQIDLAKKLADTLRVELEVRWIAYRFHARRAGCDLQMGTVVRTGKDSDDDDDEAISTQKLREVAGKVIFNSKHWVQPRSSIPYFISVVQLAINTNSNRLHAAQTYEDLKGTRIGALHSSWAHYLLDKQGISTVTGYRSEIDILKALAADELDGAVVTNTYLGWFLHQYPQANLSLAKKFTMSDELRFNVGVSLRRADEALLSAVNTALKQMLENGTLKRLYERYGITYQAPSLQEIS